MSKPSKIRQREYRNRKMAKGFKLISSTYVSEEARNILDAHRATGKTLNEIIEKALQKLGMP